MKEVKGNLILGFFFLIGVLIFGIFQNTPNSQHDFKKIVYKSGQNLSIAKNSRVEIYDTYVLITSPDDSTLFIPIDQILGLALD